MTISSTVLPLIPRLMPDSASIRFIAVSTSGEIGGVVLSLRILAAMSASSKNLRRHYARQPSFASRVLRSAGVLMVRSL